MSLLDKLKLSSEGDDLTGLLPCNLATWEENQKNLILSKCVNPLILRGKAIACGFLDAYIKMRLSSRPSEV